MRDEMRTKMGAGGRVVIPAPYRKLLEVEPGEELIMKMEDGVLKIYTAEHAITQAQNLVAQFNPDNEKLSQELIKERRKEAKDE